MYYGAIEAGGTKFRAAVYRNGEKIKEMTIATRDPETTLEPVACFLGSYPLKAVGLGAFGPIILDENDPDYGLITETPKEKWRQFNIYRYCAERLRVPVYLDTDVGVAALGEYFAAGGTAQNIVYVTVGTGIGIGVIVDGKIFRGAHHPELGHLQVIRRDNDRHPSVCPYHDNCLEGLASGRSLTDRYQMTPEKLASVDDVWELEGYYLGQALFAYTLAFAPDKIVVGGGVADQENLLPKTRKYFDLVNNGYYRYRRMSDLESYIVLPLCGKDAGLYGAYRLAGGGE